MLLWSVGGFVSLLKHVHILVKSPAFVDHPTFFYHGPRSRWHTETPDGNPHTPFAIQRSESLVACRDALRLSAPFQCGHLHPFRRCQHLPVETISVSHFSQELRKSEFLITNWGYVGVRASLLSAAPQFLSHWPWSQVTCGDTQVISPHHQFLKILTREVRGQAEYPSGYPYKHSFAIH